MNRDFSCRIQDLRLRDDRELDRMDMELLGYPQGDGVAFVFLSRKWLCLILSATKVTKFLHKRQVAFHGKALNYHSTSLVLGYCCRRSWMHLWCSLMTRVSCVERMT
ncbi:hypothetical protein OPV22_029784 [Ensete ventricosum]|uniref:Uncharacterized protein n=1 Tax=Ensete ventricosum TaxID=4639 RepID=A0AAV8P7Q7_ENSVE|nr:hypothetical protein OPV22_029784 [Ensete ventricosum]